uniref:UBA domain-containing protein n=1 Tax=Tetradesmus obliquus TaxID=3088 RepID=A0A383W0B8_TETOB|eukprot:jgi/Sobl393_1/19260/SZX70931.1
MDKRGPKIGDAASLWNFTPSPGWSKEESLILKLCLMKYGVGQWLQIQATGLLPGKMIQQLNGGTQRLLGQQSLAAYSGLRVDVDRVRADNEAKLDAHRKNGLVIWTGPNPTKEMRLQWQQEAKEKYGLSEQQQQEAEAALEELAAARAAPFAAAAAAEPLPPDINILECDAQQLSTQQKQLLLCVLHQQLQQVLCRAVQQHPCLAPLLTYQQQQQQGWLARGLSHPAGMCSSAAAFGNGTANLAVRQAGTGTAAVAGAGRASKSGSSSKAGSSKRSRPPASGKPPTGKKRARSKAAAAGSDEDMHEAADGEAAFLRKQQQRRRGASGGRGGGGSSCSHISEMMQAALEAGVAQLLEMGYSRGKAVDALQECNCDVEMAVEYLATTCC